MPSGVSGISFNGGSLTDLTLTANWTFGGTTSTQGIGNTPTNSAWINSLRSRPEGSGSVSVSPLVIDGNADTSINITYRLDPAFTVNNLRVVIPADFGWPHDTAGVFYTNMTSDLSIAGDTIYFTDISFSADSTEITVLDVTAPVNTGYYRISVQSGFDGSYGDVSPVPVVTVYGSPVPIAEVKVNDVNGSALRIGDLVTVRGIITVANEFGSPSFIQDNSAGMSIYGTVFSSAVSTGDEVVVSGKITQFNGLNQIEYPTLYSALTSGNMVEPYIATPSQLNNDGSGGVESYEGGLFRLNGVTVSALNGTPVSTWSANTNYRLTGSSTGDTVQLRIDNNTNLVGAVAPAGRFDVIGVLGQYKTSSPYIGGYQLMPRSTEDILSEGPIFLDYPRETDLSPTSLAVVWTTVNPGTSRLRYGSTTAYESGVVELHHDSTQTDHYVPVTGLTPATIYHVQAFSTSGTDTSFAGNLIVSTTSAPPTTGEVNVYFTKSVDPSLSSGEPALGNFDVVTKIVQRINGAKRSVDAAIYSLSGTAGGTVASALVSARQRGVRVRVIGEYDNRGTVPWSTLQNNGVPLIFDLFGANDGSGLSHNKFIIIDFRGGAPESVWVWTGSLNFTDPGTADDRQNTIEFQDVALAGAYTAEFQEMWGSSGDTPNSALSRFGSRKLNNTPHNFRIGGKSVECYFSPSDRTEHRIEKVLAGAEHSINTALLSFTRKGLADTIITKRNSGKGIRVIMDNNTDIENKYGYLLSNGVDVLLKGGSGLLHHKYAVIDAEPLGGVPYVVTGSHNWSSSAETRNDENTVIIQDDRVANLYLQEFAARYAEAGGTNPIVLDVEESGSGLPGIFSLSQNYPNPFNPATTIRYELPKSSHVRLVIYNLLGQEVETLIDGVQDAGIKSVVYSAGDLPSGVYIYRIQADNYRDAKKLLLLR